MEPENCGEYNFKIINKIPNQNFLENIKMEYKQYPPFIVKTDISAEPNFLDEYMGQSEWIDANILHDEIIPTITNNKLMDKLDIKPIIEFNMKLKKYIALLFKQLGIKSRNFACDFYRVKAGGFIPSHIDSGSQISLLLPLNENTGALRCYDDDAMFEITYQSLIILNTQMRHGVESPTHDRLLFRIGIIDVSYEEVVENLQKMYG